MGVILAEGMGATSLLLSTNKVLLLEEKRGIGHPFTLKSALLPL